MSVDNNIDFKDHIVEYPNRFKQTTVAPGIVELVPTWIETPEQIIQPGTPVDSELFRKLKDNVTCYSQTYTATEGQTIFSVTHPYNVGQSRISVYVGGVKQRTILDFIEASSSSFVLNVGLPAGTKVEVVTISFVQPLASDVQQQIDTILEQYGFNTIRINEGNLELSKKADKDYVDRLATSLASGSPKAVYHTVAALQTAKPTGDNNIYVVSSDGKWYYWNGSGWIAGGIYQSTGIIDGSIEEKKLSDNVVKLQKTYASLRSGGLGYYSNKTTALEWQSDNSTHPIALYNFTDITTPLLFNGTVKTYGTVTYDITDAFTAIIKLKPTMFSATRRILSFKNVSEAFELAINSSGDLLFSPGGVNSTIRLALNVETVIAITISNETKKIRLFVNGVFKGEFTLASTTAFVGKQLYIGRNAQVDGSYFQGYISRFSIFNRMLSDVEIISESNAMSIQNNGVIVLNQGNEAKPLDTKMISHDGVVLNDYLDNLPVPEVVVKKKMMHISADDVIDTFKNISTNNYPSIFDDPVMAFLKRMHNQYGMVFSGYCFYETADLTFNLSMMPSTWAAEFRANANWLKFGYHYLNRNGGNFTTVDAATGLSYYNTGITELFRICGGFESIDTVPRFHNYAAPLATVQAIAKVNLGVQGFLTSEDSRANYHLNTDQNVYMKTHDRLYDTGTGLKLFSTDLRLENVTDVASTLQSRLTDIAYAGRMHDLVIFTHEQYLSDITMQQKIETCCQFAVANKYRFDFPMYNM